MQVVRLGKVVKSRRKPTAGCQSIADGGKHPAFVCPKRKAQQSQHNTQRTPATEADVIAQSPS